MILVPYRARARKPCSFLLVLFNARPVDDLHACLSAPSTDASNLNELKARPRAGTMVRRKLLFLSPSRLALRVHFSQNQHDVYCARDSTWGKLCCQPAYDKHWTLIIHASVERRQVRSRVQLATWLFWRGSIFQPIRAVNELIFRKWLCRSEIKWKRETPFV